MSEEELQQKETELTEREANVEEAEKAVAEREETVSARETAISAGYQVDVVPANDGEHAHQFTKGIGPGMTELRICKVPQCGLTEKLVNGEWVNLAS